MYEDEIVVECNPGYKFPDESTKKILTCEVTGEWSDELPACIGTVCLYDNIGTICLYDNIGTYTVCLYDNIGT